MSCERVTVVDHPMVQHKLSKLRNKETSSKDFRALVRELAMFEGYEATRDLELEDVEVETPICKTTCKQVAGKKMVIVPIRRAGLGMVDGLQELMPSTFVGHLGMYRDPDTHENRYPRLELLRLAIPRRVYSDNHIRVIAAACRNIYERRAEITTGYRITFEAPILRHFTVELDKI